MNATPVQFDEMYAPDGAVRAPYLEYEQWLAGQDKAWMRRKSAEAESFFRRFAKASAAQ